MSKYLLSVLVLLLALVTTAATAAPTEEYMRVMALVNWTNIIPEKRFTKETMPTSFNARVRKAGKLKSLGLPVRVGDMIALNQLGPYIWQVSKGENSIKINTYDIPAAYYPRFRQSQATIPTGKT